MSARWQDLGRAPMVTVPRQVTTRPIVAAIACAVMMLLPSLHAQTFSVIHSFSGAGDGATPMAGLTIDHAGNFYGTTMFGGSADGDCGAGGCGVAFRLHQQSSGWVLTPVYSFLGGKDGSNPEYSPLVFGPDGSLYGSTSQGGGPCSANGNGCGTVFNLKPPLTSCKSTLCTWSETILHSFKGSDGDGPVGALTFDAAGNVYGATTSGAFRNGGAVYELLASSGWMVKILYNAYGYSGSSPLFNPSGNLYGTTFVGGNGLGSVYQLTPTGGGWVSQDLYDFSSGSDGGFPWAGLIFDAQGNLYGATTSGGSGNGGTVFKLTPSGGGWSLSTLYSFASPGNGRLVVGPAANLLLDQDGNLYGTTVADGAFGFGAVFKLTPGSGGWSYTSLHDFTGGSDGANPFSSLALDSNGVLYGTASAGGTGTCAGGCGVVFKITQ